MRAVSFAELFEAIVISSQNHAANKARYIF